jgi:hypothetical protein
MEGKGERGEREALGVTAQKKTNLDLIFELGLRPRSRVQNSGQIIRATIKYFLAIFIYLFLLFT